MFSDSTILSLIYTLQLLHDVLQNGVIIISVSAVYRNLAYAVIVPEPGYAMEIQSPVPWPKDGAVSFESNSLSYSREGSMGISRNLLCCVPWGEVWHRRTARSWKVVYYKCTVLIG